MKYWSIVIIAIFFFTACTDTQGKKKGKSKTENKIAIQENQQPGGRQIINAGSQTQYTGKPGQLIIVSENTVYVDELAQIFDSVFQAPIRPYYPQTDYFQVHHRTEKEFKKLSTQLRNVIELIIDDSIPKGEPKMFVYENYYARTQLYTKLKAHDMDDLFDKINIEIDFLFRLYQKQEWKREYIRHARNKHEKTREKLQKKFGIDLTLPNQFKYESVDNTYGIIIFPEEARQIDLKFGSNNASKTNYVQSGIQIWQYPYTGAAMLDAENILEMRDTILKKYAKHEMEGVYMGTQDHPAVLPVFETIKIGDVSGYQVRGLFKFTGEAEPSGGRFWSFHFKHPHRNTMVAISGYIDAPPTITPYLELNRIKAILYSLKVVE